MIHADPASFRDRTSQVFYYERKVLRGLDSVAAKNWMQFKDSPLFGDEFENGSLVTTQEVSIPHHAKAELSIKWDTYLEHEKIPFISYAYEWSYEMLRKAALFQLELIDKAIQCGMMLKDATPYNFQWVGSNLFFIDIPSFVKYNAGDLWIGYQQFCQLFLYPLMIQRYKNLPFQTFLVSDIDGISSDFCRNIFSLKDNFRKGVFYHVNLQSRLQASIRKQTSGDVISRVKEINTGSDIVLKNVQNLYKIVASMKLKKSRSIWSGYSINNSYTQEDRKLKKEFVATCCAKRRRKLVWDIGCNTGDYSSIASQHNEYVISIDSDPVSIELLYEKNQTEDIANILPVVSDIAKPSPAIGWQLKERKSLWDRGHPDLVICLAAIHHIVISSHIHMGSFISFLADLTDEVLLEFPDREDEMVKTLLSAKDDIYYDYNKQFFETALEKHFKIEVKQELQCGTRTLYFLVKNGN